MMRALGTVAALALLVAACESARAPDYDGKRSPRWSSAIVTGGSVRGGRD